MSTVIAADQVTITDITDAYSVMLSSEAYSFTGGVSGAPSGLTCVTQVYAYCGQDRVSSIGVTKSEITCPSGITADVTSGNNTNTVTITFTLTAALTTTKEATIPIHIDGMTFNKKFTMSVSPQGVKGDKGDQGIQGVQGPQGIQGPQGVAGEDAITLKVTFSGPTVFKNNTGSTLATAVVKKGSQQATINASTGACAIGGVSLGTVKWYDGTTLKKSGETLMIGASAGTGIEVVVDNVKSINCQLEG